MLQLYLNWKGPILDLVDSMNSLENPTADSNVKEPRWRLFRLTGFFPVQRNLGVEPKIGGKPPKWMIYNGKPY